MLINDGFVKIELGTTVLQLRLNEEDLDRELAELITPDNGQVHKIRMMVEYDMTNSYMPIPTPNQYVV